MSQVFPVAISCSEFGLVTECVDRIVHRAEASMQCVARLGVGWIEKRHSWSQHAVVDTAVEHRGLETVFGQLVTIRVRDAFDQSMQTQATQVIGHAARAQLTGIDAQ